MNRQEKQLNQYLQPLAGVSDDYNSILEATQETEHVFIGGATHGTHEFYSIRADITKRLILEKGFNAIAIEGDWPDAYRINQYVKGDKTIKSALDALDRFKKFPTWMWRNEVIVEFIDWLHHHNSKLSFDKKVGFYGLDLYSLNASVEIIIKYLEENDINAAKKAKQRYACFDPFKEELKSYGYATILGITRSCEDEVIAQLVELTSNSYQYIKENGSNEDEYFYIQQNTRLVKNAEKYYRSMFNDKTFSWNVRDKHMIEILDQIAKHLGAKLHKKAQIVTWAHNSHVGDARATEVRIKGQLNMGQLAKEQYPNKVLLIGFLTNTGSVIAASGWNYAAEPKTVLSAINYSYEYFFHHLNPSNFLLNFKTQPQIKTLIPSELLERSIGVIYLPETERESHYIHANLVKQFDIVIYIDKTSAIRPLEKSAILHSGEVFETFPFGV
ncbi:MAG: erythromycin esterase family protein [Flavobacteriales bacterium]|nr:erythromycin esterase family protein [Flavobacteriales bacterium]